MNRVGTYPLGRAGDLPLSLRARQMVEHATGLVVVTAPPGFGASASLASALGQSLQRSLVRVFHPSDRPDRGRVADACGWASAGPARTAIVFAGSLDDVDAGDLPVTEVTGADLLLAPSDVADYLALVGADGADATTIWQEVGGWPSLVARRANPDVRDHHGLADSISGCLDAGPLQARERIFLRRIAIPTVLTPATLDIVWPSDDARELLAWALRAGWVNPAPDLSRLGFVPTRWRAALNDDLDHADPDLRRTLSRQVADALARAGVDPAHLLRQAVEAGDQVLTVKVLGEHIRELFTDHLELASLALTSLPADVVDADPGLAVARGFGLGVLQPSGDINRTVAVSAGRSTPPFWGSGPQYQAQVFQYMIELRLSGDFAGAAEIAEGLRVAASEPDRNGQWPAHDMQAFYLVHTGLTLLLNGQLEDAADDFRRAYRGHGPNGPDSAQRDAGAKLALVHVLGGHLQAAERLLDEIGGMPLPSGPTRHMMAAGERLVRLLLAAERLDYTGVRQAWAAGDLAISTENELWPFQLVAHGRCGMLAGSLLNTLQEADRLLPKIPAGGSSFVYELVLTVRAEALLSLGEVLPAGRALDTLENSTGEFTRLARARHALFAGRYTSATKLAQALVSSPEVGLTTRTEAYVLLACAAQVTGNRSRSFRAIGNAKRAALSEGLLRVFTAAPPDIAHKLYPEAGIDVDVSKATPYPVLRAAVELTPQLRRVLGVLIETSSVQDMAARLFVSPNTVKSHLRILYRRLGVHSRDEALELAARTGLEPLPPDSH